MLGRIGDYGQHNRMTGTLLATQTRLRAAEAAVTSGRRADSFADIATSSRVLLRAEDARGSRSAYVEQNNHVLRKMDSMDVSLKAIIDIAEKARSSIVQRLNGSTVNSLDFAREMQNFTVEIANQLNTTFDGHYIFGGSKVDQAPVVLPTTPVTTVDSTLYYQGDEIGATARIGMGLELDYGVLAGETVFASLIGGLGAAAAADQATDTHGIRVALEQISEALSGAIDRRSELGAHMSQIESVNETHEMHNTYLDETISKISDTDLAEVMSQIAQDKLQLEASYVTTATLNDLSLMRYLR